MIFPSILIDRMNNLYIIQNLNIFLEEILVKEPEEGDFYALNPHYVKIESTASYLREKIEKFCPALSFISYSDIGKHHFQKIYISSNVEDGYVSEIEKVSAKEIILVEDGTFDYNDSEERTEFYRGKKLYLYSAANAGKRTREAVVLPIERNMEIEERFEKLFEKEMQPIHNLDRMTPVLFTAPLLEDCDAKAEDLERAIRFLENRLGQSTLILKKHPRDCFSYHSDILHFVECSQNVPGQLLDMHFAGDKYFFSASTVGAASTPESHFYAIEVLPFNEWYQQNFICFRTMKIFRDKHVTILKP